MAKMMKASERRLDSIKMTLNPNKSRSEDKKEWPRMKKWRDRSKECQIFRVYLSKSNKAHD